MSKWVTFTCFRWFGRGSDSSHDYVLSLKIDSQKNKSPTLSAFGTLPPTAREKHANDHRAHARTHTHAPFLPRTRTLSHPRKRKHTYTLRTPLHPLSIAFITHDACTHHTRIRARKHNHTHTWGRTWFWHPASTPHNAQPITFYPSN